MLRFIILAAFLLPLSRVGIAEAGVVGDTFSKGGAGFAIVQLLILAAFGALAVYVISALGYGQVASMTKLVTVFSCISIVIGTVWAAISKIANVFNVTL